MAHIIKINGDAGQVAHFAKCLANFPSDGVFTEARVVDGRSGDAMHHLGMFARYLRRLGFKSVEIVHCGAVQS